MPRIIITGGAGFIGSHLANRYLEQGWEVLIYDNFSTGNRNFCPEEAQIFEGDISDIPSLERAIIDFKPQVISHHAAQISVRESFRDPEFDADKNILGSINVFRLAGEHKVEQVVFASTGGVMLEATHTDFPAPVQKGNLELDSPYALSKFCAEKYLRYFANRFGYHGTVLRYANIFGPHQTSKSEAGVIAIFLEKLLNGESVTIYGDGNQTRDFLYIRDAVAAHFQATEQKLAGTYNIASAQEVSVNKICDFLITNLGKEAVAIQKKEFPFKELFRSCLDNKDFCEATGWSPQYEFEQGLKETITWNYRYHENSQPNQEPKHSFDQKLESATQSHDHRQAVL